MSRVERRRHDDSFVCTPQGPHKVGVSVDGKSGLVSIYVHNQWLDCGMGMEWLRELHRIAGLVLAEHDAPLSDRREDR